MHFIYAFSTSFDTKFSLQRFTYTREILMLRYFDVKIHASMITKERVIRTEEKNDETR